MLAAEVRRHPTAQVLGLADVDDGAFRIVIGVNAWRVGEERHLFAECFGFILQ